MPGENLTRDEARQRAALLSVDGYEVALDLRSALEPPPVDNVRTFRSTTTIRFRCAEPGAATFVDLLAPVLHSATLNGRSLPVDLAFDGTRLALDGLAAENELVVDARCAYSRTGEGLHHFLDPEDGEVYLYTQYEPADARRVFANFEQPDLKAPFDFTVTAPAHWTVLSNGAQEGTQQPLEDGAAVWRFRGPGRSPPTSRPWWPVPTTTSPTTTGASWRTAPCWTFRWARCAARASPGTSTPRTSSPSPGRGWTSSTTTSTTRTRSASTTRRSSRSTTWARWRTPGCVTFREEYVFRGKVTDAAYEGRANVILHEMAHMWFGDLVTMEWWDDLWLKESFADFMGDLLHGGGTRFTDGWITFANRRKAWAYRADQLPSTHPITADIRDLEDAKLNFDGITYAKGAAVLKQLVAYVGRDAFLEGARRYFQRHAWGNTRLEHLLSVLAETSGRDMAEWSRAWLQTAGVNSLTPEAILRRRRAGSPSSPCSKRPPRTTRCSARTGSPSASTDGTAAGPAPWSATRAPRPTSRVPVRSSRS